MSHPTRTERNDQPRPSRRLGRRPGRLHACLRGAEPRTAHRDRADSPDQRGRPDRPGRPAGRPRAELDAGGIRTGNLRRDKDLRGRRFLATDWWPVITFEAGSIKPTQTGWTVRRNPRRQGRPVPGATRCRSRLNGLADGQAVQVDLRATGRLDRRSAGVTAGPGLPHRSPDLALADGAAPAAARAAALKFFAEGACYVHASSPPRRSGRPENEEHGRDPGGSAGSGNRCC